MSSQEFFDRWKKLSQPTQESQKIFPAQQDIDTAQIQAKVSQILELFWVKIKFYTTLIVYFQLDGLGAKILVNVDPNPDNFVCAGIVQTKTAAIGTLVRLEPNKQAKMFRLTVRSSHDTVARGLCDLLVKQF